MLDKPLIKAIRGDPPSTPPIWLMRQAGRYLPEYRSLRAGAGSFLDLVYNPDLAAEVTLQPVRRFGFDAAILFSDILVVPHALGVDLSFREGEGPVLAPVRSAADVDGLSVDGLHDRLSPIYRTVATVKEALAPGVALIGFAGAPWTVATYMVEGGASRDHAVTKSWMWSAPGGFQSLIDILVEASVEYLVAQVEAGAEVLQLFESWAGLLPEPEFRRCCIEPAARIVAGVKDRWPAVPVIGFPRGAGLMIDAYVRETGIDAVGLDPMVPLDFARGLQGRCAVQGNLDPLLLMTGGGPMAGRVSDILSALGSGPFVFNLGHGILPDTPIGHVEDLVALVRERAR
ncbi:MAG: uroporphyrinogen decarboxylase [Pseudomonadota bacterium]